MLRIHRRFAIAAARVRRAKEPADGDDRRQPHASVRAEVGERSGNEGPSGVKDRRCMRRSIRSGTCWLCMVRHNDGDDLSDDTTESKEAKSFGPPSRD